MAADLHPRGPYVLWSYSFSSCLVCKSRQPTHMENGRSEVQMAEGRTAIAQNNPILLFNNIQSI